MKKILILVIFFSLIKQNSFASTLILQETKDNVMYKKYEVSEEEKESFYSSLEDIINVNSCEYKKVECNIKGGSEEDTIEIEDTQEIITKSNSLTEILKYLPKELEYSKDGYIGTSNLNINDIKVTEIYNDIMKNM